MKNGVSRLPGHSRPRQIPRRCDGRTPPHAASSAAAAALCTTCPVSLRRSAVPTPLSARRVCLARWCAPPRLLARYSDCGLSLLLLVVATQPAVYQQGTPTKRMRKTERRRRYKSKEKAVGRHPNNGAPVQTCERTDTFVSVRPVHTPHTHQEAHHQHSYGPYPPRIHIKSASHQHVAIAATQDRLQRRHRRCRNHRGGHLRHRRGRYLHR